MWTVIPSPVGDLRVVAEQDRLTAVDFLGEMPTAEEGSSVARFATRASTDAPGDRDDTDAVLVAARRQLEAYFSGDLRDFDLPLAPKGSDFQRRVWQELRAIGYGRTASYGEIAARLGLTGHGARAVGAANGRNPLPIVIPCHRVVGAAGAMTGYGGGMARKRLLLGLERADASPDQLF